MLTPEQLFKCLSDNTRLRCIVLLHQQGQLCVCELTEALALSQPKISRHLANLRQCGLLADSREGQWVFYQINPQLPGWVFSLLDNTQIAAKTQPWFAQDTLRLQKMKNRPEICC